MLTERAILASTPKAAPYKVSDGLVPGLCLEVAPSGSRLWRLRYRLDGKAQTLALGSHPGTSLREARAAATVAREQLASGINPNEARRAERNAREQAAGNTFESVCEAWHQKVAPRLAPATAERHRSTLARDVFPHIGHLPVAELRASDLLVIVRKLDARGNPGVAGRAIGLVSRALAYAVAAGLCDRNAASDLRLGDLLVIPATKHRAAELRPEAIGPMLRAIDAYHGTYVVKVALQLLPLLAVRPGELRAAEWSEFDLDAGLWQVPAERMKMRLPHLVPLPSQAIRLLRVLRQVSGGCNGGCEGRYVFPSTLRAGSRTGPGRPIGKTTLLAAMRRIDVAADEHSLHGWRSCFRTLASEALGERDDLLELCLAHRPPGLGRTYNRALHLDARRGVMERWCDYLESIKSAASL